MILELVFKTGVFVEHHVWRGVNAVSPWHLQLSHYIFDLVALTQVFGLHDHAMKVFVFLAIDFELVQQQFVLIFQNSDTVKKGCEVVVCDALDAVYEVHGFGVGLQYLLG